MDTVTTYDSLSAFAKPRNLSESADWWASADPVRWNGVGVGGYSGYGYRGVSGGVGDRRGGRDLPIFWNELDLRWYRILARHLDQTNNFAIGFLNHLVGYNVRKGYGWQACKKGAKKGGYAGTVKSSQEARFLTYLGRNPNDLTARLAFADFLAESGRVKAGELFRKRVYLGESWRHEDLTADTDGDLISKAQNILDQWRDANQWPIKSREAFRIWRREGEVFGRFFAGGWDRLPVFRLVAGELIGSPTSDSTTHRSFGIETDPDDSQTIWAYYLRDQNGTGQEGQWVDADRMIHIKCNVDSCVKRGVTDFLPMSQELEGIRQLLWSMLDTSNQQARVAWREKFPTAILDQVQAMIPLRPTNVLNHYPQTVPNNMPLYGGSLWSSSIRLSHVARVEGNREFEPGPTFNGVANYLQVEQACLRGCGHRWGMPEFFSGDASNNNMASSLVAGSPFTVAVEGSQLEWGTGWERPVALRVLDMAVDAGMLTYQERQQLDVEVTEPAVVTPEPDKDAQRAISLVGAKILSITTAQQQLSLDPQHEQANIEAEAKKAAQQQQPPGPGTDDDNPPTDPNAPPDDGSGGDDGALDLLGLSESNLVAKKVTVHRKDGTTYQQTKMVNPDQSPTAKPAAKAKAAPAAKRTAEQEPSDRVARAKANFKLVDKTIQRYAEEHNEPAFAKAIGGLSFKDNEPVDVVVGNDQGVIAHGIELKTMVSNKAGKITMKRSAMERKAQWEKDKDATFHTVVIDDTDVFNAKGEGVHDQSKRKLFYRRGFGSFRVAGMYPVKSVAALKLLLDTPDAELPQAARRAVAKGGDT